MRKLINLTFDNTFARLPEAFYQKTEPTPIPAPYLVSFNAEAAALIDLDPEEAKRPEFVETFSGNSLLPGAEPLAMLYAGHQFGQYVPQLGDGRAILLGEVCNDEQQQGEQRWDVQLKGAGRTAFSRFGDGRAVLRSTIREYLCSEAMHALGIPTSRALAIIGSDIGVQRETVETAAVLTRLAPSHVRFGSFEVFFYRNQYERIRELADYVIEHHYAELQHAANKYQSLLAEVVKRTARLIAQWQAVGFTHGVMNTDNMSILGITIDYGPFGFMDNYHADFIPNHSDYAGRYAFDQQPRVGFWNLTCLAQSLLPLMSEPEAVAALDAYDSVFNEHYGELMRRKLGLSEPQSDDAELVSELLKTLQASQVDYTSFFRRLSRFDEEGDKRNDPLRDMFIDPTSFDRWSERYRQRLNATADDATAERRKIMNRLNPKYVLRNYLAQNAITRATEECDYSEIDRLLDVLRRPYDEQPEQEAYADLPPQWSKQLVVSCSS